MPYIVWNGIKLMVVWYEGLYQNSASASQERHLFGKFPVMQRK